LEAVRRVVVGHDRAIDLMLVALLSEGHVLLEGVPGTAKTLLAQSFAGALSLPFKRIQFTPDLMPGDVLGTNVFHFERNQFVLNRGPVFTSILLADEINRTPPKTQSALLEAMQERAVTIDGVTHSAGRRVHRDRHPEPDRAGGHLPAARGAARPLPLQGRGRLPDARPGARHRAHARPRTAMPKIASFGLTPVADLAAVQAARATVAGLRLSDPIVDYVVALVRATRQHASLLCGPRRARPACSRRPRARGPPWTGATS
jgi:MoxR-like ATPase